MACQGRDLYRINNCNVKTICSQFEISVELELEDRNYLVRDWRMSNITDTSRNQAKFDVSMPV